MSEKALLCTGGGGFIGRYILSHYLEKQACELYLLEHGRFRQRLETLVDALAKHGVSCPPVSSYIDVMVDYFVKHADDPRIRKGDWRRTTT
jgi:FlaA1/EpsC-like NDP-sugar epimerase